MPFALKTMNVVAADVIAVITAAYAVALKFNSCYNFRAIFFNALNYIQQKGGILFDQMNIHEHEYGNIRSRAFLKRISSYNIE